MKMVYNDFGQIGTISKFGKTETFRNFNGQTTSTFDLGFGIKNVYNDFKQIGTISKFGKTETFSNFNGQTMIVRG